MTRSGVVVRIDGVEVIRFALDVGGATVIFLGDVPKDAMVMGETGHDLTVTELQPVTGAEVAADHAVVLCLTEEHVQVDTFFVTVAEVILPLLQFRNIEFLPVFGILADPGKAGLGVTLWAGD